MATQDKTQKTYKKPTVTQVKLEIGEAVLAGCKTGVGDASGKTSKKDCTNINCKNYASVS
jgi:hypothetical protein